MEAKIHFITMCCTHVTNVTLPCVSQHSQPSEHVFVVHSQSCVHPRRIFRAMTDGPGRRGWGGSGEWRGNGSSGGRRQDKGGYRDRQSLAEEYWAGRTTDDPRKRTTSHLKRQMDRDPLRSENKLLRRELDESKAG